METMVKCNWCPAIHQDGADIAYHRMQCAGRPLGIDPRTGAYSTAQKKRDLEPPVDTPETMREFYSR